MERGISSTFLPILFGFIVLALSFLFVGCSDLFRSSLIATEIGSFLVSLIFFFNVVTIGQIYHSIGIRRKPGPIEITIGFSISLLISFIIGKICAILYVFFCVPMAIYLGQFSRFKLPDYDSLLKKE